MAHINKNIGNKIYHWSDGTPINKEDTLDIIWNRGHITDYANPKHGVLYNHV